jgi:hypothetical protein
MKAILVAVNFLDILSITLPYNRHHFDEVWIVTNQLEVSSPKMMQLAADNRATLFGTDAFYEDHAVFNKFKALEQGLDAMGRDGWLCVAPWVPVEAPFVKGASRKWYVGNLITIRTVSGRSVSVTPDHNLFTSRGWVPAKSIRKGDNLFQVSSPDCLGAPDVHQRPPEIGQIVDAAFERSAMKKVGSVRIRMDLKPQFLDDDRDVDVIPSDSELSVDLEPLRQCVSDVAFVASDADLVCVSSLSDLRRDLRGTRYAGTHSPHRSDPLSDGRRRIVSRPNFTGLAMTPLYYSRQSELPTDNLVTCIKNSGDSSQAIAGLITPDDVVSIDAIPWSGHVYDLSTVQGWFLADGLIIHNCIMDADVLWPKDIGGVMIENSSNRNLILSDCGCSFTFGYLYTPKRRMFTNLTKPIPPESEWKDYPYHHYLAEWSGYTQIFHGSDPVLPNPPWHDTSWLHAGGGDSGFQSLWPPDKKLRTPFECLHLGDSLNWTGRVTKYVDGSTPPGAEANRQKLVRFLHERSLKGSRSDRYDHEKIQRTE